MSGILGLTGRDKAPSAFDVFRPPVIPPLSGRMSSTPDALKRGIFGRRMPQTANDMRGASFDPVLIGAEASGLSDVPLMRDPGNLAAGISAPSIATPHIKPKFFDKHGAWRDVASFALGTVGDALAMNSEGGRFYLQNKMAERERQNHLADLQQRRQWQLEDAAAERNKPQYFSGAEDRLMFDPATGETSTVYDAPTDAETYAQAMGYDQGTPEYRTTLADYTLRGYGPTATGNRSMLETTRHNNRVSLEGVRQGNRVTLEGVRQANRKTLRSIPTYGQANPRPSAKPRKAGGGASVGMTATNPQTGEKIKWNGSAWEPAR